MRWYLYVAYFFGGAFLVNAVPHFASGVSGRSFPTPFASPPGKGQSSPMVNVVWGTANAVAGYFLVCHVGEFHIRSIPDVLVSGAGELLMALMLARTFGRLSHTPSVSAGRQGSPLTPRSRSSIPTRSDLQVGEVDDEWAASVGQALEDKEGKQITGLGAVFSSKTKSQPVDAKLVIRVTRYQLIYSVCGLLTGLLCSVPGAVLFVHGISGSISWTARLFGFESQMSDAAPGTILFIVGVFVIYITNFNIRVNS